MKGVLDCKIHTKKKRSRKMILYKKKREKIKRKPALNYRICPIYSGLETSFVICWYIHILGIKLFSFYINELKHFWPFWFYELNNKIKSPKRRRKEHIWERNNKCKFESIVIALKGYVGFKISEEMSELW